MSFKDFLYRKNEEIIEESKESILETMNEATKNFQVFDALFPLRTVIKRIVTNKGTVRYYRGNHGSTRFLPLSQADFNKLDLDTVEVFEEIPNIGWIKIN